MVMTAKSQCSKHKQHKSEVNSYYNQTKEQKLIYIMFKLYPALLPDLSTKMLVFLS